MADASSPSFQSWRNKARHDAELRGYGAALQAAYPVERLPARLERLLEVLASQEAPRVTGR
jgi:hypothetical protein